MKHPLVPRKWNDNAEWFRDHAQANDVATIILHRLADDRIEEECRYLCRLKWHLHMPYQEVSYDELLQHVSPDKMATLNRLFNAVPDQDYQAIDAWVEDCKQRLPMIEDNWINRNRDSDYVSDLLDDDTQLTDEREPE